MEQNSSNSSKIPLVQIDSELNKYANQVLFPEKVARANKVLEKVSMHKKVATCPN